MHNLKILVVSSGLRPDHFGGLPAHVEDLLNTLHQNNVKIAYLNVGAKSKWPFTHVLRGRGFPFSTWNLSSSRSYSDYWRGTQEPLAQVEADAAYEKAFLSIIFEYRPNLVHFHELTTFPVSLFTKLRELSIKTVFSAADFYVLCPTVKLCRPDGTFCDRHVEELDCEVCSSEARINRASQLEYASDQWFGRAIRIRNVGRRVIRFLERLKSKSPATQFVKRRRRFDEILSRSDLVLATSRAQLRILQERTSGWKINFLQRSRKTILSKRPDIREELRNPDKIVFVALNIVNPAKGLSLLEDAFCSISAEFPEVELHLYGLSEGVCPGIRYFGPYEDGQLDTIIAQADFGILPSIWPEAFGYVGPEMLSRGLPVIASTMGAMPDYVIDGMNGLLFDPKEEGGLAAKIRALVSDASLRKRLWEGAANGERRYLTMEEHVEALLEIYADLLQN